jgi:hypothetical protein
MSHPINLSSAFVPEPSSSLLGLLGGEPGKLALDVWVEFDVPDWRDRRL